MFAGAWLALWLHKPAPPRELTEAERLDKNVFISSAVADYARKRADLSRNSREPNTETEILHAILQVLESEQMVRQHKDEERRAALEWEELKAHREQTR